MSDNQTPKDELLDFEMPRKDEQSIIKVIGVGGGGSNAVNHMYRQGIQGVDFIVCNTDNQALNSSPVPIKLQLGQDLTEGRGAGSIPEVGKKAALESLEEVRQHLSNSTKMVFITAGMGGGTGTGAAPVIAKMAKEMDVLTVGIVTIPFTFEGRKRRNFAAEGLDELRQHVDTLLVISNDRLREMYGNLSLTNAFGKADDILTTAAKGIAEIITVPGYINVDFEDVKTVMKGGGSAIMGAAICEGEGRALRAAEEVLASPLLDDSDIRGAQHILLYISYGNDELQLDEVTDITEFIQEEAGQTANLIWGTGHDENLGDAVCVTLIATGFNATAEQEEQTERLQLSKQKELNNDTIRQEIEQEQFHGKGHLETEEEKETSPKAETPEDEVLKMDLFAEESPEEPEAYAENLFAEPPASENQTNRDPKFNAAEIKARAEERVAALRSITSKLQQPGKLEELEQKPAFARKQVQLDQTPTSRDRAASNWSLGKDGEEVKLRENNSFLHDSVD